MKSIIQFRIFGQYSDWITGCTTGHEQGRNFFS